MNDKELLELAAKACGMTANEALGNIGKPISGWSKWNPLDDDGDALRLATKLHIDINFDRDRVWTIEGDTLSHAPHEPYKKDPYAATRRAIVRAAAEIGKTKE